MKRAQWCPGGGQPIEKRERKVRCPVCNRRLTPKTDPCCGYGTTCGPEYSIPRHKASL
jgi:NADH pyrophosphatase NudC (nudix superfamily)